MIEKVKALRALLEESVCECTADGKRTALQLSGGLDSAVIQAIGNFDWLYCCTWPEFDNLAVAELAARGKPIRTVTFTRDEMIEVALPAVAWLTGGKGTWSQCCQWFMARAMAADGVQIELNGEGSDELFGGYARYRILWWLDRMMEDPHLQEYGGIIRHMVGDRVGLVARMIARTSQTAVHLVEGEAMTDHLGAFDEAIGLAELIGFEAEVAAAHGLEHRWPYMDDSVRDFAHTLTEADKITHLESKHILREVARSLEVHPAIVDEVTKRGLVVPPSWAPADAVKWSRDWFTKLMADAWEKAAAA